MKIAIDCRMIGTGGIGSYISSLLPFFTKENECLLIGKKEELEKYRTSGQTEIIPCETKTFSLKEIFFFPRNISNKINRCDIYYSPYCNIPCGIRIPVCSTIHDVVFLDIPSLAGKIGTVVRKCFYKHACRKSDIIFTVSEFSKERIEYHLKTSKPIAVTYSAVPKWLSEDEKTDKIKKIPKEDKILFVGNIKKHKGLHTLIPAFLKARNNGLNAKLVIVGNAENFRTGDKTISEKIKSLPEEYVDFTGKISDEELKTLYRKCRLLVQPSLYEGFGLPPLEALQAGTNVVLSDIPVFKEIYRNYPVTFFETENSDDLAQKIKETFSKDSPENIPELYTFERTYSIIINALKTHIN